MSKYWRDFLVSQLPQEDQEALRVGHNLFASMAENRARECRVCNHSKHTGKCGEPLEYDVLSEKDVCQCVGEPTSSCAHCGVLVQAGNNCCAVCADERGP